MANLFDDLTTAIETVLQGSDFDSLFHGGVAASAHAEQGYNAKDDPYKKYGHILVRPLFIEQIPDQVYQSSARSIFHFEIRAEAFDFGADPHQKLSSFQQVLWNKFCDGGETLSSGITDNGSNLLDGQVESQIGIATIEVADEGLVDITRTSPAMVVPLDVLAWHVVPMS